jgi:hypothetical protein
MRKSKVGKGTIVGVLLALLAGTGLAVAVMRAQTLPEGPVAIVWDKEACAHCHMHVSEKGFASQLQTKDRQVLNFDDPGCLVKYVVENAPSMHALWFHHSKEERWLNVAQVGFVPASPTPMDYGYAATDRMAEGAISFEELSGRVLKPAAEANHGGATPEGRHP